jgi:predicted transcriptional regulator
MLTTMTTKKKEVAQAAKPASSGKFEATWGRPIEAAGFTQVPDALIMNFPKLGLTPLDLSILLVLLKYWQPGKPPWLAKSTIASTIGIKPRSVQRRIAAMQKRGLLVREVRPHRYGDSDTNLYHLNKLVTELLPYANKMVEERRKRSEAQKPTKPGVRPPNLRVVG